MKRKVIVTGATSFIGIALIELLLSKEYEVTAIIRPNSLRKMLLMQKFPGIVVSECELKNLNKVNLSQKKYDMLFHIGWTSDFVDSRFNLEGQSQNIQYCEYAVELAAKYECLKFLCIGSQAECGVVESPINSFTKDNPMTAYAEAKCIAYEKTKRLCRKYAINQYWPRLLSAYGPYDRDTTMVMSCIRACKEKRVLELTPAEQIWDYVYVKDVARALFAIMEKGTPEKKYSIASGVGRPLNEYINIIAGIMKCREVLKGIGKKEYAANQVMYLVGDIEELFADTGTRMNYTFERGICETIDKDVYIERG